MLAGKVIGRVVSTRKYPTVEGKKILLVKPMSWEEVKRAQETGEERSEGRDESVVALDAVGAGAGEYVFYVGSREACHAFEDYPISTNAVVGIIDGVSLEGKGK